jgi:hypothetical protein
MCYSPNSLTPFYLHLQLFQELGRSKAGRFMAFVSSPNSHKFRLTKIPLLPFYILLYHTEIVLRKKEDQRKFELLKTDKKVNSAFNVFPPPLWYFSTLSGSLPS